MLSALLSLLQHHHIALCPHAVSVSLSLSLLALLMAEYLALAQAGDPWAMFNLGHSYYRGDDGVARDAAKALVWFAKAAAHGNAFALEMMGFMHEKGIGTRADAAKAVAYYRRARENGADCTTEIERVEAAIGVRQPRVDAALGAGHSRVEAAPAPGQPRAEAANAAAGHLRAEAAMAAADPAAFGQVAAGFGHAAADPAAQRAYDPVTVVPGYGAAPAGHIAALNASASAAPLNASSAHTAAPGHVRLHDEGAATKRARWEDETLEHELARLQRDRAALVAERMQLSKDESALKRREEAVKQREDDARLKETMLARREAAADKREAALRDREADLHYQFDDLEAQRRGQRARERAREEAVAAKRGAASVKLAAIRDQRRAEDSRYAEVRDLVGAVWARTTIDLFHCQPCARRIAPGESVLLGQCLHAICRACVPHMVQPDQTVVCPVCQVVSILGPSSSSSSSAAADAHPIIEAVLAGSAGAPECTMCVNDPDDERRLPAMDRCTTCAPEKLFCDPHAALHRARQPTHTTTPLPHGGAALRCATHDKPIEAYCTGCRTLICLACLASTHPVATHEARLLTDPAFVEGVRTRLLDGVAVARTVAGALLDHAADATVAVGEADERDAAIALEVDRAISVLAGLLERRRQAAQERWSARSRDERAALQTAREESEYHWRIVTSAADLAEQLAKQVGGVNATAVMVQLEPVAIARLNTLLELAPGRGVPVPAILRFDVDEVVAEQLATLGEVVQDAP